MIRRLCLFFLLLALGPAALVAQVAGDGRGALRPYVHVFLAYGIAWLLIMVWVWRIARSLKGVEQERRIASETGRD